jgi:IS6 family transposase
MELHMNPFKGRHFQRDIILWAVRWYCKYGISYRELQEMLAERGVNVEALLQIVGGDKLIIPFC